MIGMLGMLEPGTSTLASLGAWLPGWWIEMTLRSTALLLLAAAFMFLLRSRPARSRVLVLTSLAPALLMLWVLLLPAWPGGSLQWRPSFEMPSFAATALDRLSDALVEPAAVPVPPFGLAGAPHAMRDVSRPAASTESPLQPGPAPQFTLTHGTACGTNCASEARIAVAGRESSASTSASPWWFLCLLVTALGGFWFTGRCLLGWRGLEALRGSAQPPTGGLMRMFQVVCAETSLMPQETPRLLLSSQVDVPMTWGWRRPTVLLPKAAETWSEDRRRIVLLHEVGHVVHRDWRDRIALTLARSLFWWNPLAHWAARRLALEQELRCDQWVAERTTPSRYAEELLALHDDLLPANSIGRSPALAMLSRTQLERRMMHLLEPRSSRPASDSAKLTRSRNLLLITVLGVAFLSIAAIRPRVVRVEPTVLPVEQLAPEPAVPRVPGLQPLPPLMVPEVSDAVPLPGMNAAAPGAAPVPEEGASWPRGLRAPVAPLSPLATSPVPAPSPSPSPRPVIAGLATPLPAAAPLPALPSGLSLSPVMLRSAPSAPVLPPISIEELSPEEAARVEELRARYDEIRAELAELRALEQERSAEVRARAEELRREHQERRAQRERELAMKQREVQRTMAERERQAAEEQALVERETARRRADLEREVARVRKLQAEAMNQHRLGSSSGEPSEAGSGQRDAETLERLHAERAELLRRMEDVGTEHVDRLRAQREAVRRVQQEALEREQALRRDALEMRQQERNAELDQRRLLEQHEMTALKRQLEAERLQQEAVRLQREMERVATREARRGAHLTPRVAPRPGTRNPALLDGLRDVIREEAMNLGLGDENIEAGVREVSFVLGTRSITRDGRSRVYVVGSPMQVREQLRHAWSDALDENRGTREGERLEDAIGRLGYEILELELANR